MILQACKVIASRFLPRAYLLNACFFVTYRCNAQCSFCNLGNRDLPAPELNTNEVKHIFDDMHTQGVRQVSLVGGEPMLRKDLPELITHLRQLDIFVSVVTNGFWVREDVLASKPDMLHVSLDSIGTQHDRLRNVRNGFQKALTAIKQYSALKSRYGY